jgi:hypothetical protein
VSHRPPMDAALASTIAKRAHLGQRDRFGARVTDHVTEVAAAVPPDARSVAWLHDVLERTDLGLRELRSEGLSPLEEAALELLTRRSEEPYETYTLRIAFAHGDAGCRARTVKLADLDSHIASAPLHVDVPPYAWARRQIANARWRNQEIAASF